MPVKPPGHMMQTIPARSEYSKEFLARRVLIDSIRVSNSACFPCHEKLSLISLSLSKRQIKAGEDSVSIKSEYMRRENKRYV